MSRKTGNLMNLLMMGATSDKPTVGMGITELHWTDRCAGTIMRVSPSGKTFWYRLDKAIRIDKNGMSDRQSYRYEPQLDAPYKEARLTQKGWKMVGGWRLLVGQRDQHYDYSF